MTLVLVNGAKVEAERRRLGMSQRTLAKEADVGLRTIQHMEYIEDMNDSLKTWRPTHHEARTVKKLARVFGCHPCELAEIKGRTARAVGAA